MAAARRARGQRGRAPVGAAVLALVIEKPSYGYEVWQRFEQRFGSLLDVGSSRIYQVVNGLLDEGLIEQVPGGGVGSRRQPKPRYRATARGAREHRRWLAEELRDDPLRSELHRRLLAIGANDAPTMLELVDRYEQACLDEMAQIGGHARTSAVAVRDRLLAEEQRLVLEARLKWILFARRQAAGDSRRRAAGGTGVSLLTLERATKRFSSGQRETVALREVSLDIAAGECVGRLRAAALRSHHAAARRRRPAAARRGRGALRRTRPRAPRGRDAGHRDRLLQPRLRSDAGRDARGPRGRRAARPRRGPHTRPRARRRRARARRR